MAQRIYRVWKGTVDAIPSELDAKTFLGGKGAGLRDMVTMGLNVPPAFTIPCHESLAYLKAEALDVEGTFLDDLMKEVAGGVLALEAHFGYLPLLSVRSGAPVSMPGMMDTILNVGLTDDRLPAWIERIGARAAFDSYRRLIQMMGSTAYGIDPGLFEQRLDVVKKEAGVTSDTELSAEDLKEAVKLYKHCFETYAFQPFPQDVMEQVEAAVRAVFKSWNNERAVEYRKIHGLDDDMGTAVTVQAMVFGNMGETSATGVLFSRDPSTGAKGMMGEFLVNAQGEDVVAGIRTPADIHEMAKTDIELWNVVHAELEELCEDLETYYFDMVDIEFTVQNGELFVLQCRPGKRSAIAAFEIACQLVDEGAINIPTALSRITPAQYKLATRPQLDPSYKGKPLAIGLPASPGVVSGRVVLSAEEAVAATDPVILVTHETDPDDIAGMAKAVGILTRTGGATSHAAVVARGMDKPCVVGCTALEFQGKMIGFDGVVLAGTTLSICGATGRVWAGKVPVVDGSAAASIARVTDWCLGVKGAVEPAPADAGHDRAVRIMATDWWGMEEVALAVLDSLAALPARGHVSLDVTLPADMIDTGDVGLINAFGMAAGTDTLMGDFRLWLCTHLVDRAEALQGLTIIGADPVWRTTLREAGLSPAGDAATVADLMAGGPVTVTSAFIDNVVGGVEAFSKLHDMIVKSGVGFTSVPPALPRDYAALSVLGR